MAVVAGRCEFCRTDVPDHLRYDHDCPVATELVHNDTPPCPDCKSRMTVESDGAVHCLKCGEINDRFVMEFTPGDEL